MNRHGTAAMVKRIAVISSGENSSSAIRLATKASPQMTATRMAMRMSAGFIVVLGSALSCSPVCCSVLALLVGFRFPQQISTVHGRVVIDRDQREADIGQQPLHHPAEGGIFVAHVRDDAFARKIVVLDMEVGPLLDVAL